MSLVCYRCPNPKIGTQKNEKIYKFHVKRHKFGKHFSCPTCDRPFTKITHCISHEIRVHGTKIKYFRKNAIVKFANDYVEQKKLRKAGVANCDGSRNESQDKIDENKNVLKSDYSETDDDSDTENKNSDCEDPGFYGNPMKCSNSLTCYSGPKIEHVIEAHGVHSECANEMYQQMNQISDKAIKKHKMNVKRGSDSDQLDRLIQHKNADPNIRESRSRKKKSKLPKSQRLTETVTNNPSREKQPRSKPKTCTVTKMLPPILSRVCQLCSYAWENETTLRNHRDEMHPKEKLLDLMTIIVLGDPYSASSWEILEPAYVILKKQPDKTPLEEEKQLLPTRFSTRISKRKRQSSKDNLAQCHVVLTRLNDVILTKYNRKKSCKSKRNKNE